MISKPAYSLSEISNLPVRHIGHWASLLGKLWQHKVPLTGGFVIPVQTLQQISASNPQVPSEVAHVWLKLFYEYIGDHPALIKASWIEDRPEELSESQVKGDANVMETILDIWNKANEYGPAAIVVQAQPKPQAYGVVETNSGVAHLKSAVTIRASTEPFARHKRSDRYQVDVRTWHSINSQTQGVSPVLDTQQVILVAQAGYQAKLLQFDHGTLAWTINHLHLTPTSYHAEGHEENHYSAPSTQKPLITGTSLIPGVVHGRVKIITGRLPVTIEPNSILIMKNAGYLSPSVLRQLGGLIVEQQLPATVLTQLRTFHIPTMINARGIFHAIQPNQAIVLDTVQSKVFADSQQTKQHHLKTELILETQQGLTRQLATLQPQAVLFKPDYTLVQFGTHPLHFIRSSKKDILFQSLSEKIQSFRSLPHLIYRTSNLSSADLASLHYGSQFEQPERNPDFGYRGALRSLSQSELFDFELEVLHHAHRITQQKISLLVSGVRSANEYKLLHQHISYRLPDASWLSVWLEISTPENAIQYHMYHHLAHQGIVINLPQLHALSHGIDFHNPDVYHLYTWDPSLLKHLVHHVTKEAGNLPCYTICPNDQPALIDISLESGVAGVIVKPPFAATAKEYMMMAEQRHSHS